MYLHHILGRNKEKLTRRVFNAQKDNPAPGDFIELVKGDTWHMTYDMWHMTCDMWHMMGGEYSLSSPANTVWEWQCLEDSEQKDHSMNE